MPRQVRELRTHYQPTIAFTIYIAGEKADAMRAGSSPACTNCLVSILLTLGKM